ncbi:MAG TPA: drug/metabolite exporter YedA [Gammaproteobacteria bacterium]|nr:drug/metabolite exporter YedA [Gammaproteobacteria bacterium]
MSLSPLLVACLAATWIIWGSTYLAIKFALESFPPFYQMGSRFLVAGLALMVWLKLRGRALPTLVEWRNAAIIGTLLLVSGMGFTAYSEQTVASGLVVAYIAIMPIIVTVMNLPFGVRPSRLELVGMLVGFVGVLMLVRGQAFTASPTGLLAITIACVSWSLGSVLSQRRFALAPGAMGFASEMLCGSVLLLLLSVIVREEPQWPPQPLAAWSWVYLIVFGSLLAFNAYMVLLSRVSAALASSYTFVNPVIALALGIWLGGETVTSFEWVAAGIITAGVVLLVLGRQPVKAAA